MKIFDASSIICLVHEAKFTKVFQICQNKGYRLLIPNTVFEELKRNENTYNFIKSVNYFEPIEVIDSDCYEYLQRRYPQLHQGEIGVICCGLSKRKDKQKYICIIDENKGGIKKLKETDGLKITGTLGLLIWLKKSKELTDEDCKYIYDQLLQSNFWIKPEKLKILLE